MHGLPKGIVSVVQTPFDAAGKLDLESLARLIDDAVAAGVDGFLAPVVASEVDELTEGERAQVVRAVVSGTRGRVPLIVGASAPEPPLCRRHAALAAEAYLVAVPQELYERPADVVPFFREVAAGNDAPLVVQDFQFNRPGLALEQIVALREALPTLRGIKIETTPAGPKYTAVREACGDDFWIAGGWAVPQMIEALDRGVDAMIPESSMVRVYKAIERAHRGGDRAGAQALFRRLQPVLAFSNQDVATSIAFFKRLLVAKGVFLHATVRAAAGFGWDRYSERVADELIELYLELERTVP